MTRTLCIVGALLALPALAQNEGGSLSLGVGEQKTLPLQNVARVAIGDPGVADVKQVGGGELLLTGVAEGRVYLEGETLTAEDADRVQQVVSLFPQVKSFVRPSSNARRMAGEALT